MYFNCKDLCPWSVLKARTFTPCEAHRGASTPLEGPMTVWGPCRQGRLVRYYQPIIWEHMAWPRRSSGSHMAGWSESSKSSSSSRVYWNRFHFCGWIVGNCDAAGKLWKCSRFPDRAPVTRTHCFHHTTLKIYLVYSLTLKSHNGVQFFFLLA